VVLSGRLVYRESDLAFGTEECSSGADVSVLVNCVQLWINREHMTVECVDSYCHYESWIPAHLSAPHATKEALVLDEGCGLVLESGDAIRLNDKTAFWPQWVDVRGGWVCIGDHAND
jgi:hypothetical protein